MVQDVDTEALRRSAFEHYWMHNADWVQVAEEGGPPIMVSGDGVRVTDSEGVMWLDAHGGYGSVNVGYGRSEIADAAVEQMKRLAYQPSGTTTEALVALVEKIAEVSPGSLERTLPVTGGSEANETAVKIARAYHKRNGEAGRYKVISRKGSYHGATGGVLWMGGAPGRRSDFEPAYPGMVYAPHPDPYRCELGGGDASECALLCAKAIEDLILLHKPETVAAVIGEPAAGGSRVPGDEYWPAVRDICDRYGVMLIADEVVCGFGRTGKWFGMEHWDVVPDMMTVAKGMTSTYLPMGAAVVKREIADAFASEEDLFSQALTFGGHPVSAAAALENIRIIEREGLVERSAEMGAYLLDGLMALKEKHAIVGHVGGIGLLLGVELVCDRSTKEPFPPESKVGDMAREKLRERRILVAPGGSEVKFVPPLCISRDEADEVITALDEVLGEMGDDLGDMIR